MFMLGLCCEYPVHGPGLCSNKNWMAKRMNESFEKKSRITCSHKLLLRFQKTLLRKALGVHSETCPEVVMDLTNKLMIKFIRCQSYFTKLLLNYRKRLFCNKLDCFSIRKNICGTNALAYQRKIADLWSV